VGEAGADQQTPNISSVIQEIVNRGGWTSGNSLAIIITGTGTRTAESYNGDSAGAPQLYVEFSVGESICDDGIDNDGDGLIDCADPDCEAKLCDDGLYCNEGETCQGGVCTGGGPTACDDGVSCTDDSCNEAAGACENMPNDAYCQDDGLYCNGDEYCDPETDCTSTGTPCLPGEICNEAIDQCEEADCQSHTECDDGLYCNGAETCNLTTGQCEQGTTVTCDDGQSCTDDYCNEVTDSCDNVVTCGHVEVQIAAGSDDAEESESGSVGLTSNDLELVDESTNQTVGMRFNGVDIPKGAIITNAYIQFQVDEVSTGGASLLIEGEAVDDAITFSSSSGDITGRTPTTAAVGWSPPDWTTVGEAGLDQQTPDISSVIQEIVNQSGWVSGNSLCIVITGTGKRTAESYNGSPTGAPRLYVEYVVGESICDDGVDNDADGEVDCDDPDCEGDPVCDTCIQMIQPVDYVVAHLNLGDTYYLDRDYTIMSMPAGLDTGEEEWIMTRNNDKHNTSSAFLEIDLSQDSTVYVGYDSRASALPNWLASSFTPTTMTIGVTDNQMGQFDVYEGNFTAGTVTLV
jgi:hypothetical protein